ncbi:MAG: hypothetical protein BWY53_00702 [Parcubacteria group bacterium ADurb.Bin326]|nr:MAG: hypothetical protein BWY53_00702 [Parcubacteria group bacterium ADurb.Bin326]
MKISQILEEKLIRYRYVFLFYLFVSVLVFIKIFFSAGSVVGSDWGFPDNTSQIKIFFETLLHSWTRIGNLFGTRQLSPVSVIFIGPIYLLSTIGIPVSLVIKLSIVSVFALGASNLNLLLRYMNLKPSSALIGGLVFILSPVFFDYSLIGWIYVLFSLSMLPLFIYLFLRAIDSGNYRYVLLAAIVFSLAIIQSQTIIWYGLTTLSLVLGYGIVTKQFWRSLKYAFVLSVSFLALNFYWLPALILLPDQSAAGGEIVKSSISLGTSFRLSALNILRIWGSLYNYQFENSYPKVFEPLSFVVPIIGLSCIFFVKKFKRHISYLLLIFLIPALFYFIDRQVISGLPFANLIRDVARFSVLSTFALSAMIAITIDQLQAIRGSIHRWLFPLIFLVLFFNAYPFWSGNLFALPKSGFDFRLRTKVWPTEYEDLNQKLQSENQEQRAIFLPLGGLVSLSDDLRYNGAFHEVPDVYSGYSPIPATISFSDRSYGASSEIVYAIDQSIKNQDIDQLEYLSALAKINFIVIRRDMDFYDWDENKKLDFENKLKSLVISGRADTYMDQGEIYAIKFKTEEKIIDAHNQLVEISSNSGKILADYLNIQFINPDQFKEIDQYRQISELFPGKNLFTHSQQNSILSSFVQGAPDGYKFLSLEKVRDIMLLQKWGYYQQNLNLKLDEGIKKDNRKSILAIERTSLPTDINGKYIVYLNEDVSNSTAYFESKSAESSKLNINGNNYTLKPAGDGLLSIEALSLSRGPNIFQVEDKNITPLLLKTKSLSTDTVIPKIIPKKLNASEYSIKIENARDDFYLNFAENFNSYWRVTKTGKLFDRELVSADNHFVSNGFGNGYKIKLSDLEKAGAGSKNFDDTFSGEIRLVFWPEKMIMPGLVITTLSLTIILYLLFTNCQEKGKVR